MDCDIQTALFGNTLPFEKAVLYDWAMFLSSDGYVFIKPEAGGLINGVILVLNDYQLQIADLWEEIPTYTREQITVWTSAEKQKSVWGYTRCSTDGIHHDGSTLGINSKDFIIKEALKLRHIK